MIDAKPHYRRLIAKLGGLDAVELATGRKRQTLSAYNNPNNSQQPTAEIMVELQSLAGDFTFHRVCGVTMGIEANAGLLAWRAAKSQAVMNGEYDNLFKENGDDKSQPTEAIG